MRISKLFMKFFEGIAAGLAISFVFKGELCAGLTSVNTYILLLLLEIELWKEGII